MLRTALLQGSCRWCCWVRWIRCCLWNWGWRFCVWLSSAPWWAWTRSACWWTDLVASRTRNRAFSVRINIGKKGETRTYLFFDVAFHWSGKNLNSITVDVVDHSIEDLEFGWLEGHNIKTNVEDDVSTGILNHAFQVILWGVQMICDDIDNVPKLLNTLSNELLVNPIK